MDEFRDKLVQLMREERDAQMRGKFLEILGESEDSLVIEVLKQELEHSNDGVKGWALGALDNFASRGFSEADHIAKAFRNLNQKWA